MNISRRYLLALLCVTWSTLVAVEVQFKQATMRLQKTGQGAIIPVTVTYKLVPDEVLFQDSLAFSINHPGMRLTHWSADQQPTSYFDDSFKETKLVYHREVTFTFDIILSALMTVPEDTVITMHYLVNTHKQAQECVYHLQTMATPVVNGQQKTENYCADYQVQPGASPEKLSLGALLNQQVQKMAHAVQQFFVHAKNSVALLVERTQSWWLRVLFVFILGVLMSLTPCIYPMIPITIGVLQTGGKHSLWRSFLLAGAYTLGISLTFATLGLLAATGGVQFGSMMTNPFVIGTLVLVLGYLGFSMLGAYDMYVPKFMQPSSVRAGRQGSLFSAFIFGAMSGMVASPCLSPGLALVLTMVAAIGNKLFGFGLLFAFGVGSSLPLLIIGTFSSALNVLPRAGMWMVEVKKVFGFMLFAMCLYYVKAIIALPVFLAMVGLFLFATGIYYIVSAISTYGTWSRLIKNGIGVIAITAGCFMFPQAWHAYTAPSAGHVSYWHTDYQAALVLAQAENKKVLLDFGAEWCSLCKAMEKGLFSDDMVVETLQKFAVPVKIDCTDVRDSVCVDLKWQYEVLGFPTFVLIDPVTQAVIKRWGSELNDIESKEFIAEFVKLAQ